MRLPYAVAFELHSELERVPHKRRLRAREPTAESAERLLFYEIGFLQGGRAWDPERGDRVVVLADSAAAYAELAGLPHVDVVAPEAVLATDARALATWRAGRRLQLATRKQP